MPRHILDKLLQSPAVDTLYCSKEIFLLLIKATDRNTVLFLSALSCTDAYMLYMFSGKYITATSKLLEFILCPSFEEGPPPPSKKKNHQEQLFFLRQNIHMPSLHCCSVFMNLLLFLLQNIHVLFL